MPASDTFRRRVFAAFGWSLLQNFGGRVLALLGSLILARFLGPTEFGLANAAVLTVFLAAMVADLGFADAIARHEGLTAEDGNLPFAISLLLAVLLAAGAALASGPISRLLGAGGLAPLLAASMALVPVVVAATFQEAWYRRAHRFRELAQRTLVCVGASGVVGVACALAGLGAWALVAQFATQALLSAAWMWARPAWVPSRRLRRATLRPLCAFGLNLAGLRVLDFATMRAVDALILARHGTETLGYFAIAGRIVQTLNQLLQASVNSVALSVLREIVPDPARLARAFLRTVFLAAMFAGPAFLGLAATAPELVRLVFGPEWMRAGPVLVPMLVAGTAQCIQLVAGAFLLSAGRSDLVLRLVLVKACIVLPGLILGGTGDAAATARLLAALLLAEFPVALGVTARFLGLRWEPVLRAVGLPLAAGLAGLAASAALRVLLPAGGSDLGSLAQLSAAFVLAAGVTALATGRSAYREGLAFLVSGLRGAGDPDGRPGRTAQP